MSGNDLSLELKLKADASQYTAELTRAGQTLSTFTAQVQGGGAAASGALQSMATAAQRIGDSAGGAARKLGDDLGAMAGQLARGGDATQLLAGRSEGLVRTLLGSSPALGAAAAGVMVLAAAYQRGSAEAAGYRQALIMTGNAAETSVGQMADMARAIGQVVGTQGAAAAAVTQLAASGKVGGEAMQGLAQSAIQAQRSLGVAVDDTVRQYAQLADKPVEASVKLNESVRHLTAGTYDQIRAAQEQGRAQDAARLAQQAYADTLSQRAAEMEKSLGTLQRAWRATGEAAKGAWDWMLNLGRERTAQQQLDSATRNVEALQQQLADQQSRGRATGQLPEQLAAAQRRLLDLQNEAALTGIAASAQAEQNQATQAYIALGQLRQQHLSAEEKMQRAVADATRAYEGALKDTTLTAAQRTQAERDYLAIVSDITRGKETAAPKARQAADTELASLQAQLQAARQYHEQLLTLGAGASQLNAAERESLKLAELIRQATDAKTIARLQEKQAIADALGVQLRSNAGLEASFKSHQALIDATAQDADALNQRAAAQEAANQVFGKGRTAIEEMTLAELQKQMAEAQASDSFDPKYIASLELKIAAQERWVGALQGADYKAATKHVDELLRGAQELARAYEDEQALSGLTALEREKIVAQRQVELKYAKALAAIDKAALTDAEKQALRDEAQEARRIESAAAVAKAEQQHMARAADEINRSLTDALMRGFENGKGFAQNLADTTVNLFKTMVLRPTISAIMTPVSLVINGVVQQGLNAVGLGSGGSGLMGLANNASSLYSGASSFNTGWFTNFGATAPASLYSSGAQLYSQGFETIGNGMMDLGNNLAQYSEDINTAATWISYGKAVYDLTQGKYGSAVGTAVGSYFFGPIGAAIGSFLGGLVDKWTGSRGANHSGGAYGTSGKDRNAALSGLGLTGDALGDFTERGNQAIDEQLGKAVESMGGLYNSLAKYAGGSAKQLDIVAGFAVNGAHKDEDAYGYFKLLDKLTGETLASYSKRDGGLGSDPEKAWAQYIADMGGALVGELRKADIPKWMDDIFAGMGDKITLDGLNGAMQQIAKIDGAFTQLGWHIGYLADISGDTQTALLELSGGVDGLMKNTGAYYQNFYSADEQRAATQRQLQKAFDSLHLKMPDIDASDARAQYRALAEAQDLTTESGRKTWAAMMGLSEAFASVTDGAAGAATGVASFASQMSNAFGMTGDTISQILHDSVKEAQSAQEARRLAAEGFEQSIYDNAFSGLTSGLGDMIMSGVVTPMMNSLLAGATASSTALATGGTVAAGSMAAGGAAGGGAVAAGGAAAGGAVAAGGSAAASLMSSFMDSARAYIGSFTQILSDPEVRQGIKDISALVGDVAGTLYQSGGAFSGGGSSPTLNTGSGQQAASEADNLNDALKRLGETMGDEVKRLRGLMVDDSSQSQAVLLARFATSTAAARAGDLKAAELLPELSKAIEAATKASAFSAVELARMRGWLAGSLEETAQLAGIKLPAFAVGTNYVPRDMLALIHEGEAIVPKAYNPAAQGADSGAPVQALHMSFERFAGAQLESSLNAQRILLRAVRVLERWESGGMPAQRAENWSPA